METTHEKSNRTRAGLFGSLSVLLAASAMGQGEPLSGGTAATPETPTTETSGGTATDPGFDAGTSSAATGTATDRTADRATDASDDVRGDGDALFDDGGDTVNSREPAFGEFPAAPSSGMTTPNDGFTSESGGGWNDPLAPSPTPFGGPATGTDLDSTGP